MTEDKKIQNEAGATLLNEPVRFKIKLLGVKLPMGIRPLHPGTIIKISKQVNNLEDVNESEQMIHEMLRTGANIRVFCRVVALAILNNPLKIKLFARVLSWLLMWRVESTAELFTLTAIVYKQLGAEHFFFTMQLTRGMNFLRRMKQAKTEEDTASGEQLP